MACRNAQDVPISDEGELRVSDEAEGMTRRVEEHDPVCRTGLIGRSSSAERLNGDEGLVVVVRCDIEMCLGLLIPVRPVRRAEGLVALETNVHTSAGIELCPSVVGGRSVVNLTAQERLVELRKAHWVWAVKGAESESSDRHDDSAYSGSVRPISGNTERSSCADSPIPLTSHRGGDGSRPTSLTSGPMASANGPVRRLAPRERRTELEAWPHQASAPPVSLLDDTGHTRRRLGPQAPTSW